MKISLIAVSGLGLFVLGRATAPKPQPQIKIIDNSQSIEKAIEQTKKQMTQALQKQVILDYSFLVSNQKRFSIQKILDFFALDYNLVS